MVLLATLAIARGLVVHLSHLYLSKLHSEVRERSVSTKELRGKGEFE